MAKKPEANKAEAKAATVKRLASEAMAQAAPAAPAAKQYKAGSKVQACWEAFQAGGETAFVAKAKELALANGTINEWKRMFARNLAGEDTTKPRKPTTPAKPASVPQPAKPADPPPPGGFTYGRRINAPKTDRIYYCGNPSYTGKIIKRGEDKSLVMWDNGNKVEVPNGDIHPLTDQYEQLNATGKYKVA